MSLFRERVSQSKLQPQGLASFRAYPCVDERWFRSLRVRLRGLIDLPVLQNPKGGLGEMAPQSHDGFLMVLLAPDALI